MPITTGSLDTLVDALAADRDLGPQIVHRAYLPPEPLDAATLDPPLAPQLVRALAVNGVDRLFSHQAAGIAAIRAGRDVLITTPTASGKSLIFQAPVLEEALEGGDGRALFLYPLKALGQDQRLKFDRLAADSGLKGELERAAIYDGDTPRREREAIRAEPPRVVISNPDMLHLGFLAHGALWVSLWSRLRWIVLDELHTYRGMFGSHFHHVLQRLLRQCARFGATPQIVASSATASNALDFARTLTERSFVAIDRSGAPREGRHFVLLQPAGSPYTTALQLLMACTRAGLKTIVFTKARRITELLHSWLREKDPELARRVANYRAGFLPEERREIERALFEGRLDAVISTSALELGIDVGGLDACILVGFPGSMMATWQRAGRVGRSGRESIVALIALPDALDQYLLQRPQELLERACEPLVVSPGNRQIAERHLLCAAAEMPLERERDRAYLERHAATVGGLLARFELAESEAGGRLHATVKAPHRGVSLRGSGATYTITSEVTGRSIGTVDGVRALRECHPGAIYLHGGRQYAIVDLDPERRQALARPVRVDFFTMPLTEKHTTILEVQDQRSEGTLCAWLGRVLVTERVVGFERRRISGQERLGQEALELWPVEFETVALWFAAPQAFEETLREHALDFMGALHAAEHTAISLFPILALCDRGDLGGISIPFHPQVGCGAVFVYDGHEGGIGIAESGFARLPELLERVRALLAGCACAGGCPGCVQSPKCGNGNRPLDKAGALRLLGLLLGHETPLLPFEAPQLDLSQAVDPAQFTRVARFGAAAAGIEGPSATTAPLSIPGIPGDLSRDLFDLGESGAASSAPARSLERGSERRIAPPMVRRALPRRIARTVLFDVETKRSAEEVGGWHNLHRLGVALAVSCSMEDGRFTVHREQGVATLIEELRGADLVVGFNVFRFDYPVLSGYTGEDFRRTLPTLDLFEQVEETVGERVGLSRLCKATFGVEKTGDGLQSLAWYREGRFDLIEAYCRHDVELLRDLYLFGRREGHVLYAAEAGIVLRVPVDWP